MSLGASLLLLGQLLPVVAAERPPVSRGIVMRTTASAEIVRAGRLGGQIEPEDVVPQRRRTGDGRVLTEYR